MSNLSQHSLSVNIRT